MRKKITAFMLAMLILVQTIVPGVALAAKGSSDKESKQDLVKVGELDIKDYPKLDNKTILAIQKQARENQEFEKREKGAGLFSADNPYLPGQNPTNEEKAAAFGNLKVKFKTFGLKENGVEKDFQWNEIFGTDSNGNSGTVDIYFIQKNAKTNAELNRFKLSVDKSGDYILKDLYGNPADLPLYSNTLEPYKYDVELDTGISEKVKFLTVKLSYSGDEDVSHVQRDGKIIYNIPFDIQIAQVASTKFVSEWHTGVEENNRPAVNGDFDTLEDQDLRYFPFPKNDTDVVKLRMESFDLEKDEWPGYDPQTPPHLRVIPKVSVEEDMLEDPATYTIDKNSSRITANGKTYKYDLQYDVINGGKLTMTEVIPVTFNANGGKFGSITDPSAEQKIVKEVEYNGTLTDKAENPTKSGKAFKGWATDKDGTTLATDDDFKNITAAKTFHAIWSDEDIQAEELKVAESYGNFPRNPNKSPSFTNDFVPTFNDLKDQVKVKDANGDFVALPNDATFTIVDDKGNEYDKDSVELKKFIYRKVREKKSDDVSRIETVKAKIKYSNGPEREIDIHIKVLKNIYKGTDEGNKYPHIPKNYVKVTIDPTDKAEDQDKTYYYVNPEAEVIVPVKDPVGKDKNNFSKWTKKADSAPANQKGADYKTADRYKFTENSTITAQYEDGIIKIKYVDENGNEIDQKYWIAGNSYPSEKKGGLGRNATESEFDTNGPDFKGYVGGSRHQLKGESYKDPKGSKKLDTVTYYYSKKVTTDDNSNLRNYFKVIFDANDGEFRTAPKNQKDVYVLYNGNDATVEKVTFDEVRQAVEDAYGKPTKANVEFRGWQNKKDNGAKVADTYEIKFPGWVSGKYTPETFYAAYSVNFTVKKVWEDDVNPIPTMNFTLYRKVKGSQDDPVAVQGEDVKEITKDVTEATWTGLDKTDDNGKAYEYSVKETFKDTSDIKNANWILGEMEDDGNGNKTIINKLKTVPGAGETSNEEKHRMGKLTITKKIESKVTQPQMSMRMAILRANAPVDPLAFTFKVTDPYGKEEIFKLSAGESKELNNLLYGEYTVAETDAKGLTPYFTVGSGSETKGSEAKVTLTKDAKEGKVEFTNKNINSLTNPNVIEVKASKVWENGPVSDHTAVDLKLYRQVDGGQKEEVTGVTPAKTGDINKSSKFDYVWKDLPKINDEGKEYTYTVEEVGVSNSEVKIGENTYTVSQNGNTITNTYKVSKADVTAKKVWVNGPEADHKEATLNLFRKVEGGQKAKVEGVNPDVIEEAQNKRTFNYTWKDLPETDDSGKEYTYTVEEANVNNGEVKVGENTYTVSQNGNTITNTYKVSKADVTAKKVWVNGPEADHTQATLNLFRQVEGRQKEQVTGATLEAGEDAQKKGTFNYTWKDLPTTDEAGNKYSYTVEEAGATNANGTAQETTVKVGDNTYVVTVDNLTNTVTNTFKSDNTLSFTINKVWPDKVNPVPTMNFTLYRKVKGSQDDPVAVQGAEVKEITKATTTATWNDLPKTDDDGKAYEYSVKETFKNENSDIKNANWILGEMEDDGNGNKTITNKLKTVPGAGEAPDESKNFVGKLKIKKVLENEVVKPTTIARLMRMMLAPSPVSNEPLEFKFKVTGPYGYENKFELKANEIKTLENLPYGKYKVEEVDTKGYTAEYSKKEETLTKDSPNGYITVTNKNIKSTDPQNPNVPSGQVINVTIKKVWVGGEKPATTIELWRKGEDVNGKEFDQKVDAFTTVANGEDQQSKEYKDLPKHDPSGKEFVYYAKEIKVPQGYTATYSDDRLTVTNSLDIIKDNTPDDQSDKPDGYVAVTFKAGKNGKIDDDTKDIVYYVNPNADPVKTMAEIKEPSITANTGYKVADPKWKENDGSALDKTTQITKDLTYTAQYEKLDDVIPSTGNTKPDGYLTVTFDKGYNGESLKGETIYYVKPGTAFGEIKTRPTVIPEFGYEFIRWETSDRHIFRSDGKVTAYNKKLPVLIPEKDPNTDDTNKKPNGYVTVTLIPTEKATDQTKENKVFFVNPKEQVEITSKPSGRTKEVNGIKQTYVFKGWKVTEGTIASWDSENIKGTFIQDTEITAQYKALVNPGELIAAPIGKKNVITPVNVTPDAKDLIKNIYDSSNPDSKDNLPDNTTFEYAENGTPDVSKAGKTTASVKVTYPNGKTVVVKVPVTVVDNVVPQTGNDKPDVPANYVKVEFVIDPATGGKIADGETTIYYVKPNTDVTIPQPNTVAETGYAFDKWDTDTTKAQQYNSDTKIKGSFTKGEDIIPATDDSGKKNEKPEGYVSVIFDKGEHGKEITGQTVYYVNPNANKTLAAIKKPTVTADTGWKVNGWDKADTTEIKGTDDIVVTSKYDPIADVIPKDNPQGGENKKPDGYITVKFDTTDKGKIEGTTDTKIKVVYVNPTKAVVLKGQEPKVTPNTGFEFADWDMPIDREIVYKENDVIKAKYNPIGSLIPKENDQTKKPDGYVTVTFVKGEHGEDITGTTVYYVDPNRQVTVPAPTVTPETGWKQKNGTEAWDSALTRTFDKDTKITAQYDPLRDIIPKEENGITNSKPKGYVTVIFKQGAHGTIDQNQKYVFYVNPKVGKKLSDLTKPTVEAHNGWKYVGWDKNGDTVIDSNTKDPLEVTAKYLKKVLTTDPNDRVNYVKVDFKADDDKQNPARGTLDGTKTYWVLKNTEVNVPAPIVKPDKNHEFTGWKPVVKTMYDEDTTHIAQYKKKDVIVVPGPSKPTDEKDPNKPEGGRINGKDRTETSIEISKKYFGQANTVIVVDRKDFPDAMTASVLSKLLNAPILLTETNRLDPRVAAEIQRLGARDVIIVGGNSSVSEAVKKELAKFDKDEVERIYGRDRYETSAQVARRVVGITGKIGHGVVASGEVFADALTVAPFAAREGYPILLVKRNSVPPTINKAIKDLSITKVTIAGGYSTVAKSLESSLPKVVERLRGNSRYETAIDIVNKKFNNANEIFLANGEQWMDALVIGPVGGILDIPILLTGANNAPQSLKDYIAKSKIEKITAIGGRSMVSDKVLNELGK